MDIETQRLIEINRRRLQKLREQEALYGISVDPRIPIEIEKIEAEIVRLKQKQSVEIDTPKNSPIQIPLDTIPEPSPLPGGSRMPFSRNPLFVGRKASLKRLVHRFGKEQTVVPTVAITGIGGVGKTQLASEFVHRYGRFFDGGVYWLNFSKPEDVATEVADCGSIAYLNLFSDHKDLSLEDKLNMVLAIWRTEVSRLLVFDNCEDEELLNKWRPTSGGCFVLITSRRAKWSKTLGIHELPLGAFDVEESATLICKYATSLSTDNEHVKSVCNELGNLPLAIHLAGSYLGHYENVITPKTYLEQLNDTGLFDHPSLKLQKSSVSPTGYEYNIVRAFALSYEKLKDDDAIDVLAVALLHRTSSFLADSPIPHIVLSATLNNYPLIDPQPISWDNPSSVLTPEFSIRAEDSLHRLVGLGLLVPSSDDTFHIHSLLSRFVREVFQDAEAKMAVWNSVGWVASELRQVRDRHSKLSLLLLPHLKSLADAAIGQDAWEFTFSMLSGFFSFHIGDYEIAKDYFERGVRLCIAILGENHPDTPQSMELLGLTYHRLGNYKKAQYYIEQSVIIYLNIFGEEHPITANGYRSLGELYHTLGNYSEAQNVYEKALEIHRKLYGENNFPVSDIYRNLATVYKDQSEYLKAKQFYEKALSIQETIYSEENSSIACTHNDLGLLLVGQRKFEEARKHLETSLKIQKSLFGDSHPEIAVTLNNIGQLYEFQRKHDDALYYYKQSLAMNKQLLGHNHPSTARNLSNISSILVQQQNFTEAHRCLEDVLRVDIATYGENHPEVAMDLGNMGTLYYQQGNYDIAQYYLERALAMFEIHLGDQNVYTMGTLLTLMLIYQSRDMPKAYQYYQRLKRICRVHPSREHPDIQAVCTIVDSVIELQKQDESYKKTIKRTNKLQSRKESNTRRSKKQKKNRKKQRHRRK